MRQPGDCGDLAERGGRGRRDEERRSGPRFFTERPPVEWDQEVARLLVEAERGASPRQLSPRSSLIVPIVSASVPDRQRALPLAPRRTLSRLTARPDIADTHVCLAAAAQGQLMPGPRRRAAAGAPRARAQARL
jgi:hypothetical protein